ncbi:MAG: serine dehydratase subunit alpha family protein, partial [Candidatus Gallimonas sp.]
MDELVYRTYLNILREELLPAMGCTEPISLAYAAALARETLGKTPSRVEISVSGNILKNVKSAIVPNTGGMKGVCAAAAAGIVAGDASLRLEVLSRLTDRDREKIGEFLRSAAFEVKKSTSECVFDVGVRVFSDQDSAFVRIEGHHTNVVAVERNGTLLKSGRAVAETGGADRSLLSVRSIVEFADCVDLAEIEELIDRQIRYNSAIAEEGLKNDYGARVGKVLLQAFGKDLHNLARATAAAGSDARMNGCALPVVIVSGSGNQGITASLPVVVYAKRMGATREQTIRSVLLSDLVTIHLKTGIGRLSAYC